MRRASFILGCTQKTVARKLKFLADRSQKRELLRKQHLKLARAVQFDDLETFEHTKLKPLAITLAVESESRRILGFAVSQIPAKGLLAHKSLKKYGKRPSKRASARNKLLTNLKPYIASDAEFLTDQDPHYAVSVKSIFPHAIHETTPGRRGCVVGQGELKAGGYDPLFWLNHTAAMLRANINRLFRRTWCTTKKPEGLIAHLWLYVDFHNQFIVNRAPP